MARFAATCPREKTYSLLEGVATSDLPGSLGYDGQLGSVGFVGGGRCGVDKPGGAEVSSLRFVDTAGPVVGSLCTGLGGLDLGVAAVLGGRVAWYSEIDSHACVVLRARFPVARNLGDLRTVDFTTVEPVEVLTAGFPCQDISAAGRRAGIEKGTRSGLWHTVLEAVRVLGPRLVVVENVAALRWKGGGLDQVLGGLAEAGYDAVWRCVRAADIGAAHRRERVFVCAVPQSGRSADDADPAGPRW